MSKGTMDTALERIRTKIAELETKIADLRVAERELQGLDKTPVRQTKSASEPKPKQKPGPKPILRPRPSGQPTASEPAEARQTIGAAVADVLDQHGSLSAAEIAEHIKAAGRDINNRAVSFSLQALKKRGLVKTANGKWTLKARSRRARPQSGSGNVQEAALAS